MSEQEDAPGREEFKQAADELRQAAEHFGDRVLGREANAHLRQAARHGLQAARSILDRVERELGPDDEVIGEQQRDG